MDQSVLDAIKRWPNVPAVFGWLSLSKRGQWRLHPNGTANQGGYGETIENQQILSFMDRNYDCDEQGRWFFQNGPQRVFVRLDAAPLIVSVTGQPALLRTHNQHQVKQIERWVIDREGQLYLQCEHGPAMICDQDLELVASALITTNGTKLFDWWESHQNQTQACTSIQLDPQNHPIWLENNHMCAKIELLPVDQSVADFLGFVQIPESA